MEKLLSKESSRKKLVDKEFVPPSKFILFAAARLVTQPPAAGAPIIGEMIVNRTMMRIARRCRREHRYHRSPAERRDLRAYIIKSARRWRRLP